MITLQVWTRFKRIIVSRERAKHQPEISLLVAAKSSEHAVVEKAISQTLGGIRP